MSTATGIQQTRFAPQLCEKVGALARSLFGSYNVDSKGFDCPALVVAITSRSPVAITTMRRRLLA